jgi:hypothetical protein
MKQEQIKDLIAWLGEKISISIIGDKKVISFDEPPPGDFADAGFGDDVIDLTLNATWWRDMRGDIIETPEFAEPEADEATVLKYARDVVYEYISKRLIT